jgi:hypothetical protein
MKYIWYDAMSVPVPLIRVLILLIFVLFLCCHTFLRLCFTFKNAFLSVADPDRGSSAVWTRGPQSWISFFRILVRSQI